MSTSGTRARLIVALDTDGYDRAATLVELLSPHVDWFKVGSVLFTRDGTRICRLVKERGARLFLDLKFHDIPNTVSGAVESALETGADMMTLHASGGEAMMRSAVAARDRAGSEAMLVGVTVLTHLTSQDLRSLYVSDRSAEEFVLAFAKLAQTCGLDGIVASARELPELRRHMGPEFTIVTPGIRMADAEKDDQARVVTPDRAVRDGASFLVVGRPIIAAPDPVAACRRVLADMAS